jgi:hypothetical protein
MSVAAVGGEGVIVRAHCSAKSGGNCLHAQRQVGGSLDQILQEKVVGALSELAKFLELLVHAKADVLADVCICEQVIDWFG